MHELAVFSTAVRRLLFAAVMLAGVCGSVAGRADEAKPLAVASLSPPGGQAGTTVVVTAEGEFPSWPVQAWTDRGSLVWTPHEEAGQFAVTIPPDGTFGLHRVRFYDASGATAVVPFLVGNLPERAEAEPNNTLAEVTPLDALPQTINGLLEKSGDVDSYRVQLQAGETLVAALEANRLLGSPVDAVLELVDEGGAYIARNLDATGLDPRLGYTAVRDGLHVIRVYGFPAAPNSTIGLAGGGDHRYRLTVSKTGLLTGCLPAVAAAAAETSLRACGFAVPENLSPITALPGKQQSLWAAFPGVPGVIELPVVAAAPLPIGAAAYELSQPLSPPFVASGQFTTADEEHRFCVAAVKDQKLQVRLESQAAGFEADPLLAIHDAEGAVLVAKQERDASLSWAAAQDGLVTFAVRDRRGRCGPGHLYRLSVEPETPAFTASVSADQFTAAVGEPLAIEISINRQFGFAEPITFSLAGSPDGVTAEPVTSANEGDAAKKVTLTIHASAAAFGPLWIEGRPQNADTPAAAAPIAVVFGGLSLHEAWLTVLPRVEASPQ
ncbi:MAG: PPC domain-containing protein [Pirellulales bacterium]|nr:PPC domain-containing protein [Pirellulales bacterium]